MSCFKVNKTISFKSRICIFNELYFNMSLKKEFDPYTVEEDYLIEDIIQRALRDKKLEYQDPDVVYDIFELNKKWEK